MIYNVTVVLKVEAFAPEQAEEIALGILAPDADDTERRAMLGRERNYRYHHLRSCPILLPGGAALHSIHAARARSQMVRLK